jgi:PAS domain S-box-containing protein
MKLGPVRISLIYFFVSCIWITLSDKILFLFQDALTPNFLQLISSSKGVFYVLVSTALLWQLIKIKSKRLKQSEKQYRLIYEDSPIPNWIYDLNSLKFVSVNESAIKQYGYSREEFLNMSILDIRPAEEQAKVLEAIHGVSFNLKQSGTWIHRKANGNLMHVIINSHQIVFENRNCVMVAVQDVSESIIYENKLKELNRDLLEEKRKLSETQQIARVGGWEFYLDTQQLIWSDEMYIITEVEPNPALNLYELYVQQIHPDDRPAMVVGLKMLVKEGAQLNVTHRIKLLNGEERYLRQLGRLEYLNGRPYKVIGSTQDVTALKQLETERNRYLYSLEDTLTNINEGFYTLNKDLVFTNVNRKFELETGLNKADVVGKQFTEVFPGSETRITYKQYLAVLEKDISVKFEAYWRHFKQWYYVSAYPTEEGIAVYFTDITQKKENEIRLNEVIERYEIVTKATQDVIYDYDVLSDNLIFNTRITELIDCEIDSIGGDLRWWRSLIHPEDRENVLRSQYKVIANKEHIWRYEYRIRCGADVYKYIYSQAYYIYNEANEVVRIIGAVKDIDELKRVNEENKRLAEIITKINNMVVVMDTNHRITWVNKAFEVYTGYTYAEVKGNLPRDFLGENMVSEQAMNEIAERKSKLETFTVDLKHYLKNGTTQWVNIEYTPLFNDCIEHIGYIAVHNNITERKDKEEKIYKQNKILQEISWLSSHEIRKPVASILGLVYLAKDSKDAEEREQIVEMIDVCAQELDSIVHTITDKISNELYVGKESIELSHLE